MRDWETIVDPEILAIRERQAARLRAEHQRMWLAQQRANDSRIVAERERRVEARRAHDRVRLTDRMAAVGTLASGLALERAGITETDHRPKPRKKVAKRAGKSPVERRGNNRRKAA